MLISFSYRLGEISQHKYFESYKEMGDFIDKCLEVDDSDFRSFDLYIYRGKEEDRVRKLNDEVNHGKG